MTAPVPPALLLLGDGRFPAGTHAHSGGLEAAAALEDVDDVETLEEFLRGRLSTAGLVASAFAAASCAAASGAAEGAVALLQELDAELDARTPSPVLRRAAHRLGRQLLRTAGKVWPSMVLDAVHAAVPGGLQQAVTLGAVAAAAGLDPGAAAVAAAHDSVMGPATAAVRLLGLDPVAVHAAVARLGPELSAVATEGAGCVGTRPAELPSTAAPLLDICAERHATWEVRLFAS